ncbi:MAG: hypothetical protein KF780_08935 [Sphingomonas sp.]|nr:hypothetical protein [Sphingomonas sp.]
MKKFLMAATAIAAMTTATPALADGDNTGMDQEVFTINGVNPPKCNLEATSYAVNLPANVISDNDGFARTDVSASIASGLNALGINAWCTGNKNKINAYRTALTSSNTGTQVNGFNTALIWDVTMTIAGAVRSDGFGSTEGTADGIGNGPGFGVGSGLTVGSFGPSGLGAPVTFAQELPSAAVSAASGSGPRSSFSEDTNRLAAGNYFGTLTVEITPGV